MAAMWQWLRHRMTSPSSTCWLHPCRHAPMVLPFLLLLLLVETAILISSAGGYAACAAGTMESPAYAYILVQLALVTLLVKAEHSWHVQLSLIHALLAFWQSGRILAAGKFRIHRGRIKFMTKWASSPDRQTSQMTDDGLYHTSIRLSGVP